VREWPRPFKLQGNVVDSENMPVLYMGCNAEFGGSTSNDMSIHKYGSPKFVIFGSRLLPVCRVR